MHGSHEIFCGIPGASECPCLELAKLHAALAQVAATALNSDGREWVEVAGRKFSSTSPTPHVQGGT